MYASDTEPMNPVTTTGGNTEYATGAIVIGCLVALIFIARGFRGVHVGGVSVGVK
jgi:hypothetical protein